MNLPCITFMDRIVRAFYWHSPATMRHSFHRQAQEAQYRFTKYKVTRALSLDMHDREKVPTYRELAGIAEHLLERADEDESLLARELDLLEPEIRRELLQSDFLNAYQVYYYFFREAPGDLERERLILQPASALVHGVMIAELELLEIIFRVEDDRPVISVSDGEQFLVNYRGKDAYRRALRFIDDAL